MSRIFISATRKSSGKTTIAIGLCAALAKRGRKVRPFKKGPDYIDPMWLSRAAGDCCINLDFHTMHEDEICSAYHRHAHTGDLAIIEGNKGLFDGLDPAGGDSNAALAKLLDAPVVLVLDATGMTRGVAPLLLGYQAFDPGLKIAGVILNNVGGARHETKLRAALELYTDIAVLGAVHKQRDLTIAERHLGLITDQENTAAVDIIQNIADAIATQVDLDAVRTIADAADTFTSVPLSSPLSSPRARPADITIAIARDAAFGFYYADDLRAFETHGARLLPFDAMNDTRLPEADGLYIGGGFPETHGPALARNDAMRTAVKRFVERGGPVYAECGGLMYLSQSVTWADQTCAMAGAIPARIEMTDRPVGRGYVILEETGNGLWPAGQNGAGDDMVADIPAHEFHYSRVAKLPAGADDARFAYRVKRGYGINGRFDGLVHRNTLANYSHFRNTAANPWVQRFVAFVRACKAGAQTPMARPEA